MPVFTGTTDTVVHVYQTMGSNLVGHSSAYIDQEHPGTEKKIEGWGWDKKNWPQPLLDEGLSFVPSVWDPTISGLSNSYFQSGYGDNDDLLLLGFEEIVSSGLEVWAPRINHGHFYIEQDGWYLFSDSYQTEYFSVDTSISGMQYVDLSMVPKPTIPIHVQNYKFDTTLGRYEIETSFRKKVEFTSVSGFSEFKVDVSTSPPRLWLDGIYSEEVGSFITLASGVALPSEVDALDFIGVSDGTADQLFNLSYSPLDPSGDVQVWVYQASVSPQEYDVVSGQSEFVSSGFQVILDKDLGALQFGDWDGGSGAGMIPPAGYKIGAHYTKGVLVHYEPENTQDDILALEANVNPVTASTGRGFVQVSTLLGDPASVELTSELPTASPTYVIDLGNNIGTLVATVKDAWGRTLEGEQVSFSIEDPQVGSFGGTATTTTSVTDRSGQARAIYNSPLTISDIGRSTTSVDVSGGNTIVTVSDMTTPTEISGVYLYKIHSYDEVLGIPSSGLDGYYEDYLTEIEASSGVQATSAFEIEYRTETGLTRPVTYSASETSVGKKSILITKKPSGVLNPKTGALDPNIYSPLYPTSVTETGTSASPEFELGYSGLQLDVPVANPPVDTDVTKAYFAIADANTSIQASVQNRRTGRTITSNTITVRTEIPSSANGTYALETLNTLPSGLLTKTQDVTAMTDNEILTYSGSQYSNYLTERTGVYLPTYGQWDTDTETLGLWHLDQDLVDEVTLTSAENHGLTPSSNGVAESEAYEVTASGQFLLASGIFGTDTTSQGTWEFYYKADYPNGLGETYQVLSSVDWGNPGSANQIKFFFWDDGGTIDPQLVGSVNVSGDTYSSVSVTTPGDIREILDTLGGRAEWHHYKLVWEVSDATARAGLFLDDKKFSDISTTSVGFSSGSQINLDGENGSLVLAGYPASDSAEAASGLYDEIRISNVANWDNSGIPVVNLTFSGQDFIEWFKETRKADSEIITLDNVLTSVDAPFEVPLGWRLRDSNVTIASILDQVTYLDPNDHLPSGYHDV